MVAVVVKEVTEAQVTNACIGWLRARGWICRRQHVGGYQPISGGPVVRMGERGECDWRCMRVSHDRRIDYFELEMKATGKQPRQEQYEYMAKRTHQGFNATWANSLDMLKLWYMEKYGA